MDAMDDREDGVVDSGVSDIAVTNIQVEMEPADHDAPPPPPSEDNTELVGLVQPESSSEPEQSTEEELVQIAQSDATTVPEQNSNTEHTVQAENEESPREASTLPEPSAPDFQPDANYQNTDTYRDERSESAGSEQEVKIEYLAQALADNLHREHPAASHFNFEEFETEQEYHQHQERLQLHLYQQHVLHQQELHRQHDRARQQHQQLSIEHPGGSAYSAMPSPGSKFLRHQMPQSPGGTVRTERTAQTQSTAAWYRADEAANYVNRAGSPCSRKDRLYEAMPFQYFEKEFAHNKYAPQFPHQPVLISKPSARGVEDDKDGFFQRLYETHFHQRGQIEGAQRQTAQYITQVGNTVHPRVLTDAERDEVTNRLLFHKEYTNRKFEAQRSGVTHAMREQRNGRFVDKKSHKLVAQTQRNALSEIFDVLLVTAQMERERSAQQDPRMADFLDRDGVPVETGEEGAQKVETPVLKDVLDTSLAQARFLQPKQLADAIGVILDALNLRSVSRKQFVEFTLHCMNKTYQIQPKPKQQASPQPGGSPSSSTAPSATPTQPSPLNMASHLAPSTPPKPQPRHSGVQNPLLEPVHVSAEPHSTSRLTPLDTSEQQQGEDGPATEAVEYPQSLHVPFSPSNSVRARSRTSSPVHTPRANKSSMLRTTLGSPATLSRARTPNRSSSKQNIYEREGGDNVPVEVPVSSMPVMIPPIGYLLVAASTGGSGTASQREREEGTQAQREYREHFTGRPHLEASKTTEKLVKQRYAERVKGKQKVEDSLLAYAEQKRNNNMQRSMELDRVTSRDCTFQPNINTPYMLKFKSTGKEVPEHRNVRAMIRRSASRFRAASSGEAPPESEGQGDNQTDTSRSVESDLLSAGLRNNEHPSSSNTGHHSSGSGSGRRQVNTRPEVLGAEGFEAAPQVTYLDQKEILGFRSRSNSANKLRRSGSDPRMRAPMEEIPFSSGPSDYGEFDDEYQTMTFPAAPSPSGARTTAASALYRSQNGFSADPAVVRKLSRTATAPGRFSYSAAAQHAAEQVYSYQNQYLRQSPRQSPAQSPGQYNNGNNQSQFFPSARDAAVAMQGPSPSPRSQAGSALYLAPTPRSPRTASAAEYKLTEEALHRKMYKDLYYNF